MLIIGRTELQHIATQLRQAMYNHEQWHKDVIRSIVCRLPHDPRDTAGDAHRQCRFGQWYYSDATREFRSHPAFEAMELEHRRMHEVAARMLLELQAGHTIDTTDYDNFASALERLRLELMSMNREIDESLYRIDALTGAENREGMLATLREMQALVRRSLQSCTIAMLDLDHFKRVNDSFGHVIGDDVLAGTVSVIRGVLRPYDRVFRFGGEEFLLVLPNTSVPAAREIAERVREQLGSATLATVGATPVKVTASIGLAAIDPSLNIELSIDRADRAMFAAKAGGRNRTCCWDPSMTATTETATLPDGRAG